MFVFVECNGNSPPVINYTSKTSQSSHINFIRHELVLFCAENVQFSLNSFKEGYCNYVHVSFRIRPPLWSSGQSFWLQMQMSRIRFPALPDFLSSSGSGTGSTQPREVN